MVKFRAAMFVAVGAVTFLIYSSVLYFSRFYSLGMGMSVLLAYAMAVAFHFPANRYITFHDRHTGVIGEFARYLLVYTFSAIAAYWLSKWFLGQEFPPIWGYLLPFVSTAISYLFSCMFIWKHQSVWVNDE